MKHRITLTLLSAAAGIFCSACMDYGLNVDPTRPNEKNFDPNYLLTSAQLDYGNVTEFQLYTLAPAVQVLSSTLDYFGGGDKYTLFLNSYNDRFFTNGMLTAGKLIEAELLAQAKDADAYHDFIQVCRILGVLNMQRITDTYGDVPYTDAGQGKAGIQYPTYDSQEAIYKDLLPRLEAAVSALGTRGGQLPISGDMLYGGDVDRWRKFGYSLLLRVAMRLTKADPGLARQYAEKCAGQTFSGLQDNAILRLDNGANEATQNRTANALRESIAEVRWSAAFLGHLQAAGDPRLYVFTEKADTGLANNIDINGVGMRYTSGAVVQPGWVRELPLGMPNGYDLQGNRSIAQAPGYPGPTGTGSNLAPLGNYARPRAVFRARSLPIFLFTFAQTQLLLAEAKMRGWDVGPETAAAYYASGVQAAMQGLEHYNGQLTMGPEVAAYVDAHPLDDSAQPVALQMINTQYWIATLFDFAESWSNYRRSGYPALVPVDYPGNITNASIPRRLAYPLGESSTNSANYRAALEKMGGADLPTNRVWWDR